MTTTDPANVALYINKALISLEESLARARHLRNWGLYQRILQATTEVSRLMLVAGDFDDQG